MFLNDLNVNQECTVKGIIFDGIIRRRLMDLGILPGSVMKCVLSSPSGNPKAYFVKGSVIAIRNCDASFIEVDLL